MELRDYQNKLIEDIRKSAKKGHKSICVVLPCGGGKTPVFADLARTGSEKGRKTLILSPMDTVQDQIIKTVNCFNVNKEMVEIVSYKKAATQEWLSAYEKDYFSTIIVDEAHHSCASSYEKVFSYFGEAFRLGFTATPERLDGKPMSAFYSDMVKGPSAKKLIKLGHLVPSRIVPNNSVRENYKRTNNHELSAQELAQIKLKGSSFQQIVNVYLTEAPGKSTIAYCPNIEFSKKLVKYLKANGIEAMHLDGTVREAKRKDAIEKFKAGEVKVICNVNLIGEGFDFPACEAVLMLRPTLSRTLYIQQAMRCMRKAEGKTEAVIIDFVENTEFHGVPEADYEYTLDSKEMLKIQSVSEPDPEHEPKPRQTDKDKIVSVFALLNGKQDKDFGEQFYLSLQESLDAYEFVRKVRHATIGIKTDPKVCGAFIRAAKQSSLFKTVEDWELLAKVFHYRPGWAERQV